MNNLQALKKAAEVYQQWQDHKLSDFKLIKFQKEMIEEYEKISTELLEMLREVCGEINIIPCTCIIRETGDINGSCRDAIITAGNWSAGWKSIYHEKVFTQDIDTGIRPDNSDPDVCCGKT